MTTRLDELKAQMREATDRGDWEEARRIMNEAAGLAERFMTVEDVKHRVLRIDSMKGDDEAAHSEEDDLRRDVLGAIANGAPDAAQLAAGALKTEDIEFARWCA